MSLRALVIAVTLSSCSQAVAPTYRPLPGFGGLAFRDVEVPGACTSSIREIRQAHAGDDPDVVTLLTWPRLTGLDGTETSQERLERWLERLLGWNALIARRWEVIAVDRARPPVERVEALARIVIAFEQVADLVVAIEVPRVFRSDRAVVAAFCSALTKNSAVVERAADEVRTKCTELIDRLDVGAGWWTEVCAPRIPRGPPAP